MKKTLLALAVASLAAPIASQADTTLYGRVDARVVIAEDQDINQKNGGVRIGVKTNHDLGNGLSSFAKIETNISLDATGEAGNSTLGGGRLGIRQAHAGLKGGFGAVTFGRQSSPYSSIYKADMFNNFSGAFEQGNFRIGKALGYESPDLGGFTVAIAASLDGEGGTNDGEAGDGSKTVNMLAAAAKFSIAGVSAAIGLQNRDYSTDAGGEDKASLIGGGLSYQIGAILLAAHAEKNSEGAEDMSFDVAAKYSISDATSVGGSFASTAEDKGDEAEASRFTAGVYHTIGSGTTTYAEMQSKTSNAGGNADDVDSTDFSVGFKVTF